ncbi:MAG: leucine-rich repeat protein [Oscillospiraceae bacterium]|nr:leucine-rich repeat protein [Oscillospiraceae bacterium]
MKAMTRLGTLALVLTVVLCAVVLPDSAKAAVYESLKYTVAEEQVTILDCDPSVAGELVIPDNIEGYPVTAIGNYAFYQCPGLTSVVIPEGVTAIGNYAFSYCSGLRTVSIPQSAKTLGRYSFWSCGNLTELTIPDQVTTIGNYAFTYCAKLTEVTIPASVTSIGSYAFTFCPSLTGFTVDGENSAYSSDSSGVLLNKAQTSLIQAPGGICGSYHIADGVKSIGSMAFNSCKSLTEVTVPASVTSIGQYVFNFCSNLTAISVDENNAHFCSDSGVLYSKDRTKLIQAPGAFSGSYEISGSVTAISEYAFSSCNGLTSVSVGVNVEKIGNYAFAECTNLTGIWVDEANVHYCSDTVGVLYNKDKTALIQAPGTISGSYSVADGVTSIGVEAFCRCAGLTEIVIPSSVTTIGNYAFSMCQSLQTVGYKGSQEQWDQIEFGTNNGDLQNAQLTLEYGRGVITQQPSDIWRLAGGTTKFAVTCEGTDLQYQWQFRTTAEGQWKNSPATGNATAELTVPVTASRDGYQYRCMITDSYGNVIYSNEASLHIITLKITAQPAAQNLIAGSTAKFAVTCEGTELQYQWQYRTSADGQWKKSPATGNATAELTVPVTASRNGYQYRCVITDSYGNVIASNEATLNVVILKLTAQPAAQNLIAGSTAKFTVKAQGTALQYQWQFRTAADGQWKNSPASGNQTATLSVPATKTRDGYQYRCVITDGYGNVVCSTEATLNIVTLKVTAQPKDAVLKAGGTASFAVTAKGTGVTFQWQYRASADGQWKNSPASGNQTATLSVPATKTRDGNQYRCVITDSYGNVIYSNVVTLTVE